MSDAEHTLPRQMDAETRTKFNNAIDVKLRQMISEAYKLRDLSTFKPLGADQRIQLNHLLATLEHGVERAPDETAALMEAEE